MRLMMMENDQSVCDRVELFFEREGWTVDYYGDGQEGLEAFRESKGKYDFLILSLKLMTLPGLQVLKEIRKEDQDIPILILSEKISESDQIIGLEMGADDYITKPFSEILLIAKIRAIYRRYNHAHKYTVSDQTQMITTATLKINKSTREVVFCGKILERKFQVQVSHPLNFSQRESCGFEAE